MKTLTVDAEEALAGAHAVFAGAIQLDFGTTYRLWSGVGDLEIDEETFSGVDAPAIITPISGGIGGAANGATLTLSNLEPAIAATIEAEDYAQQPFVIWLLIFSPDGSELLHPMVWLRGRVNFVTIEESIGGSSDLIFALESSALVLSRSGYRVRADVDQRILGGATDGSLKSIAIAAQKTLYWGARPVTAGSAVNGGAVSSPGYAPTFEDFYF